MPVQFHIPCKGRIGTARRGFTLVELLVVIGIISVLIAILLPALNRARESAKATKCLSNMRQISIVLVAYCNENKGWLPYQPSVQVQDFADTYTYEGTAPTNWSCLGSLVPYFSSALAAGEVFACPTAGDTPWNGAALPVPPNDTNYMANAAVTGHNLARMTDTSDVVWLQEDRYCWSIAYQRPYSNGLIPPLYSGWCFSNGTFFGQEYSNLHNTSGGLGNAIGGGNVAYLDGHADYRRDGSLHPSDFGLVGIPGQSSGDDPNTVSQGVNYTGAFDN